MRKVRGSREENSSLMGLHCSPQGGDSLTVARARAGSAASRLQVHRRPRGRSAWFSQRARDISSMVARGEHTVPAPWRPAGVFQVRTWGWGGAPSCSDLCPVGSPL